VATTRDACVPLLVKRHIPWLASRDPSSRLEIRVPLLDNRGLDWPDGKPLCRAFLLVQSRGQERARHSKVQVVLTCPRTRRQGRWRQHPGWAAFCLSTSTSEALAGVSKTSAVAYPPDRKDRALSSYLPPDGTPAGNTPDHPTPNNPTGGGGVQNTPILARAYLLRSQVERPPRIQTDQLPSILTHRACGLHQRRN
jgi:hypothetical protein